MNDSSAALSTFSQQEAEVLVEKYRLYLLLEQGLSENTRMAYQRDVDRFLEFLAEVNVSVLVVTLPLLHEYTQHLFALGVAARSMARMLSGVRSFYRFLQALACCALARRSGSHPRCHRPIEARRSARPCPH